MTEPVNAVKLCRPCGQIKPLEQFYRDSTRRDGRANRCNVCHRASVEAWKAKYPERVRIEWRNRKYGLLPGEYEALHDEQGGLCAICEKPPTGRARALSVDHDHDTGRIRGLLCTACNLALGHLKDSKKALRRALDYLKDSE